ncbi:GNAT family N-acetyltransferase [Azorhizobium doebereinerae]|uniref:GNAT family N-acetyltransferase n=1 Tax=Azorhizobium doebereinerae TaxID=281091 RepID=UPI00041C9486|nr:GNAT family N-acetyltransferase [Azorhizobium doebereinerae]
MSPDLRLARPDDRPAVEALVHAAYSPYVHRNGLMPGPMRDDYGALIGDSRVHVVERDGALLGLVVLLPQQDAMLLDNVAVDPALHGSGIGRILLQFAEQAARDAGYGAIRLYTQEIMTENVALYTRIGYRETHRVEEKGLRRIYMLKTLAD